MPTRWVAGWAQAGSSTSSSGRIHLLVRLAPTRTLASGRGKGDEDKGDALPARRWRRARTFDGKWSPLPSPLCRAVSSRAVSSPDAPRRRVPQMRRHLPFVSLPSPRISSGPTKVRLRSGPKRRKKGRDWPIFIPDHTQPNVQSWPDLTSNRAISIQTDQATFQAVPGLNERGLRWKEFCREPCCRNLQGISDRRHSAKPTAA